MAKRRKGKKRSRSRALSLKTGVALIVLLTIWGFAGEWFVHHPRKWLARQCEAFPKLITTPLFLMGNPLADITDGLGWTGHDAVYEYDTEAPSGEVFFAGAPVRVGAPAPNDIVILDRGEFKIGWSNTLRHPVWCAYHVPSEAKFDSLERPGFTKDKSITTAPRPADYTKSGYDRGHMVPNYAIVTRFGPETQKKTFMMSNICPQRPALNRGVWRNVEHRIADLWTARYGEIWVVVGCIPSPNGEETITGTNIDVPTHYYQVILAQEGMDVRALAVIFEKDAPWSTWAARNIITIDELEEMTGLDFNPDLPSFIQDPLESELPSRLWPIRTWDIFKLLSINVRH